MITSRTVRYPRGIVLPPRSRLDSRRRLGLVQPAGDIWSQLFALNCHQGMCCPITNPTCAGTKNGITPMFAPGSAGAINAATPRAPSPLPVVRVATGATTPAATPAASAALASWLNPQYLLYGGAALLLLGVVNRGPSRPLMVLAGGGAIAYALFTGGSLSSLLPGSSAPAPAVAASAGRVPAHGSADSSGLIPADSSGAFPVRAPRNPLIFANVCRFSDGTFAFGPCDPAGPNGPSTQAFLPQSPYDGAIGPGGQIF